MVTGGDDNNELLAERCPQTLDGNKAMCARDRTETQMTQ
jgi:hypothetical protein